MDFSWQILALLALQEAAEAFLVRLFEDAYLPSLHASHVMLSSKDAQLAWRSEARIRDCQGNRKYHQKTFDIVCDEND